nr:HD domain-containing protein [Clostridiales bacterium]
MNFKKIGDSQIFEGFCIIKNIDVKMTAKGSSYLDMTVADNDGEINAKLWDYKENIVGKFEKNDFVKVRGNYVPFNDSLQFRIDRIRLADERDEVKISDYVPSAVLEGDIMLTEIEKTVDSFSDKELRLLVTKCLEKNREKLLYWPAAKSMHHAVRSGLLMHTLTLVRLAQGICKVYPFVNRDLLLAGAILHDLAKIEELKSSDIGIAGEYTAKGNLLGHLVMGAIAVDEIGKENGISEETLMLVEHMLISHHGTSEFGAVKSPMFIEAELLSEIDLMDARVYE